MIGELNIAGVFFSPLVAWAVLALVLNLMLRQGLIRFGVYRFVWHRALFDLATFVMLWAAVTAVSVDIPLLTAPFR
jgi:hypothetical protein